MFRSCSGVGVCSAEAGVESESKISDSVHLCSLDSSSLKAFQNKSLIGCLCMLCFRS